MKNKLLKISIDINYVENDNHCNIFILNINNHENFINSNPINLIIINTSYNYSKKFLSMIFCSGIKSNVKKIITTDSIIKKYFFNENDFKKIFPNCNTIQVNSFDNNFFNIPLIIDNLEIIEKIEYNLDDNIFVNNIFTKYYYFFESILTSYLANIKYLVIKNKTNINDFNNFIIKTIQRTNIISKKYNKPNYIYNKSVNLLNFIFIDYNNKIIINEIL